MKAVLYYGTGMPDADWARRTIGDVVLQPYHPLVAQGGFADMFPNAERYVYVNPTSIDPWRLRRMASTPPLMAGPDPWGLPRIDLSTAAGRAAAVCEAEAAAGSGELDGLFIDDLDRLTERGEWVDEFLRELHRRLGRRLAVFANRGFALWPRIPELAAVLLEDLNAAPREADDSLGVLRWTRELVVPAVRAAHRRGIRVHRLEYADTGAGDSQVDALIASFVSSAHVSSRRRLDMWPAPGSGERKAG